MTERSIEPHYFLMAPGGFVRREIEGIPFHRCSALEEIPYLCHGFSTRHGGVSSLPASSLNLSLVSWDAPERVQENRRRFLAALNLEGANLLTLSQIHSDRVHIIDENVSQWNRATEGDALITGRAGVALAVQVADCLPILLADPVTGAIASVHAGWRGTLARIALKTARKMSAVFGCNPDQIIIAIGPGIRACCFEVGAEVVSAFEREFPGVALAKPRASAPNKHLLDLRQALDIQFAEAGLSPANIFDLGVCTRCNLKEFFSYRGEGPRSGRMMGVIARTPQLAK